MELDDGPFSSLYNQVLNCLDNVKTFFQFWLSTSALCVEHMIGGTVSISSSSFTPVYTHWGTLFTTNQEKTHTHTLQAGTHAIHLQIQTVL